MGRLLLLLIAGAAVGSIALTAGRPDLDAAYSERETQSAALAREVADAAHAAAVGDMVDPATRRFRTALSLPTALRFGSDRARIDDYHLEDGGRTAVLTVTGYAGGVAHRVTSRYGLGLSDFPGPLWVDAPVATALVDPGAAIEGTAADGTDRPVYFDATRFTAYRLGSAISLRDMERSLGREVRRAGSALSVRNGMAPVLATTGTPTLAELYDAAVFRAFDARRDVALAGGHTVRGTEAYGRFDDAAAPDPRIVRVTGPLTVPAGATLTGNGMLVVEGDLTVAGTLRWDGLVLVTTPAQRVAVRLPGTVEVRGSLLVDQEAPPPGGHTDLTVLRDLSGTWPTPAGTAGDYPWALRHTHRIEASIPDRTFHFAESASDRHEPATRFEETLARVGGPVFLRLVNTENHGASRLRLRLGGADLAGSAASGFPAGLARPGDAHATRDFAPADLTDLTVEVRSLRMLAHLSDREPSAVERWMAEWMPGGRCSNRPACVGQLRGRDEALTLQVVRAGGPGAADDRVVYEAALYWHTKDPGHPEFAQEQAADARWRADVAAGTGYGARLELGPDAALRFSLPRMAPIAARLGLAGDAVTHVGTVSRHWVVGESAQSSATGTTGAVTVCAAGATRTLDAVSARAVLRRGATLGACGA
ncbi:MAG TPA: hypothetical protein VF576_08035 [Rubricoccaceae bacterium]